mmetsp:Transcript_2132/g.5330  ORF Transcript_2132/g.5330 Transcript_2132/m.5330 type:complete len:205 (-) Transcript_2132:790-1404(-)
MTPPQMLSRQLLQVPVMIPVINQRRRLVPPLEPQPGSARLSSTGAQHVAKWFPQWMRLLRIVRIRVSVLKAPPMSKAALGANVQVMALGKCLMWAFPRQARTRRSVEQTAAQLRHQTLSRKRICPRARPSLMTTKAGPRSCERSMSRPVWHAPSSGTRMAASESLVRAPWHLLRTQTWKSRGSGQSPLRAISFAAWCTKWVSAC